MDLDELIIAVYCLIDEGMRTITHGQRLRQRGPQPIMDDREIITIETVGSFLGFTQDQALVSYFQRHWMHFFPRLPAIHRTTFVRQAANLWAVKERLWQWLSTTLPHDPAVACVDSFPLPVCRFGRAHRNRCFPDQASYGRDYLSKETFFGFRVHLRLEWPGVLCRAVVAPANWSELEVVPFLLDGTPGFVLGDRGYWQPLLMSQAQQAGIALLTPYKRAAHDPWPRFSAWLSRKRYRIETVISQLVDRFRVREVWARDWWHLWNRLLRAFLMHTMVVAFNGQAGRPPLRFDQVQI